MILERIANEVLIAGKVLGKNDIALIGAELGYTPVLMINALFTAVAQGKLKSYSMKDTILNVDPDVQYEQLAVSEDFFKAGEVDLQEQVKLLVKNFNSEESDISAEELSTWMPGSTVTKVKMIAFVTPGISTYKLADPNDKESVYTFLTLDENVSREWGKKQFVKKRASKERSKNK